MAENFYSQPFGEPIAFLNNYASYGNSNNIMKPLNSTSINDLIKIDETSTNNNTNIYRVPSSSLRYFGTQQSYNNMNIKNTNSTSNLLFGKYSVQQQQQQQQQQYYHQFTNNSNNYNHLNQQLKENINYYGNSGQCYNRNRYMPYHNRHYNTPMLLNNNNALQQYQQQHQQLQHEQQQQQQQTGNYLSYPMNYSNQITVSNNYSTNTYDLVTDTNRFNNFDMLNHHHNNDIVLPKNLITNNINHTTPQQQQQVLDSSFSLTSTSYNSNNNSGNSGSGTSITSNSSNSACITNSTDSTIQSPSNAVTLQINNLDYTMDEASLRTFLLNQLKPITPVVSLIFEGSSYAKVTVPDAYFAKQVVANLHRKKNGHKRMVVSYTRDSSSTEVNTLRCQVAGLLKDVPYCTLPMYKFRELFQSRFKTSISVIDLYKMQDICTITLDKCEEKFISLNQEFINKIADNPQCLQDSIPYCTIHFKREQHKGWAEQEIEPLPNVFMTLTEIKQIIYPLLKKHLTDVPVVSLVHCIASELDIQIQSDDNGVNLEHLICCINGVQITTNNYGIKILGWLEPETVILNKEKNLCNNYNNCNDSINNGNGTRMYSKNSNNNNSNVDPLHQISREVIELIKMSPKSTMKFNRFIPAYHNHFGKQCRVADYGYTKLVELFEALSTVVQIIGDGENRQITLTHRTQIRRFTTDLLRILRAQGNKSILLSQLPEIFSQIQQRIFDITDYGVCSIVDILDGLANSNIIVLTSIQNGKDILISIPKRKQTALEIEKTCVFASEVVELFRNAPNYSILFQKFVRSYHYHFGFQCRLSDYGFLKLADLMESIQGIVEIEFTSYEDKKIFLSAKIARRVFAEQLEELILESTGSSKTCMKFEEVLKLHKKKFGYQIQHQTLGYNNILNAVKEMPYIELIEIDDQFWVICHNTDQAFRNQCYRACMIVLNSQQDWLPINEFINLYAIKFSETISESKINTMKHAIEIKIEGDKKYVRVTRLIRFLMKIIKTIDQKFITLLELKNILNINLGDCFEFSYPNLYTLLREFNDLFACEIGQTQDRSEFGVIVHSEFVSFILGKHKNRQSLSAFNGNFENSFPTVTTKSQQQQHKLSAIQKMRNNKENSHHNSNGSFNTSPSDLSTTSDFNLSMSNNLSGSTSFNCSIDGANSINAVGNNNCFGIAGDKNCKSTATTTLWERRNMNYSTNNIQYNENDDIFELLKINPTKHDNPIIDHSKTPDTPFSKLLPFWVDPIWQVSLANESSDNKCKLTTSTTTEKTSYNFLPMLLSPHLKNDNLSNNMFPFDSPDKKIS